MITRISTHTVVLSIIFIIPILQQNASAPIAWTNDKSEPQSWSAKTQSVKAMDIILIELSQCHLPSLRGMFFFFFW